MLYTEPWAVGGVLHETLVSLSQITSWDKGPGEQFRIKSSRGKRIGAAEIDCHTHRLAQGGTTTWIPFFDFDISLFL